MSQFNLKIALNATLYLVQKIGPTADKFQIVRLLYLADRARLLRWGQTITGDQFAALPWGPVGSETLDMLDAAMGDPNRDQDLGQYLRQYISVEGKPTNRVTAKKLPDMRCLAIADLEALDEVLAAHGHYSLDERFQRLVEVTHDRAYHAAKERNAHWMTYEDLAEGDEDLLDLLKLDAEPALDIARAHSR